MSSFYTRGDRHASSPTRRALLVATSQDAGSSDGRNAWVSRGWRLQGGGGRVRRSPPPTRRGSHCMAMAVTRPGRKPRSTRSSWLPPRCCGCRPWCRERLQEATPSWSPWEPATPGRSQTSSPTAPNCCSTCAATTPTCGTASFTRSSASSPLRRRRLGHPKSLGRSDRVGACVNDTGACERTRAARRATGGCPR
jgi:hypothetical protein